MGKFVTAAAAQKLIEKQAQQMRKTLSAEEFAQCALDTLEMMQSKRFSFKQDNSILVQVDATRANEICVAIKVGDEPWRTSIIGLLNANPAEGQGGAIKHQMAAALAKGLSKEKAEHIVSVLRNVIVAADYVQENPQHAMPFTFMPLMPLMAMAA